jgi:hypothetical protein
MTTQLGEQNKLWITKNFLWMLQVIHKFFLYMLPEKIHNM